MGIFDNSKDPFVVSGDPKLKSELKSQITFKQIITIAAGKDAIELSKFTDIAKIYQLKNGSVIFDLNNPIYFQPLSMTFNGPNYHQKIHTEEKGKVKKKRHGLAGAVIGGALTGGVGAVAGGIVGHGMGKDEVTNNSITQSVNIEDPSTLTMELLNTLSNQVVTLTLRAFQSDYQKLQNLKLFPHIKDVISEDDTNNVNDQNMRKLKNLKKLLDSEIITQDEFDEKKKQILGL